MLAAKPTNQTAEDVFWVEYLTPEETAKEEEFRSHLTAKGLLHPHVAKKSDLCRFLKARKWDLEKSSAMYADMVAWRKAEGVDTILDSFTYPELRPVKECYPHFYHEVDKFGRPVYVELIKDLDVKKLLESTTVERFLRYHVWTWELLKRDKFPTCSKIAGREVYTCCVILDVQGVGLSKLTSNVLSFIKAISKIDQDYYPEHLGQMFIINAPALFSGIWAMIKPFLDERTRKKIQVLGTAFLPQLTQSVPIDNVPDWFGGKSKRIDIHEEVGPWAREATETAKAGNADVQPPAPDGVLAQA